MMAKKLYLYKQLDVCDPLDKASYHREGGLVVITSGYPNDAVARGTGNHQTVGRGDETHEMTGLPEPDLVVEVVESVADAVIAFPDTGCC